MSIENTEENKEEDYLNKQVVLMHGFTREEVFTILRAVKSISDNPSDIAFATSTPNNIEWKLKDIIKDVREDHEYYKNQKKSQ